MTPALLFIAITSTACPPCQALHRDYADDARIEWREDAAAREEYRVKAVPTVVAMREGREVGRHVGYRGRDEMERWMRSMEDRAEPRHPPERRSVRQ